MVSAKSNRIWILVVVGNISALATAWRARSVLAGVASVLVFNAVVAVAWRRAGRPSQLAEGPGQSHRRGIKTLIEILFGIAGLSLIFVGAVLPLRLPRDQRNVGLEFAATVGGIGLIVLPYLANRKK